MKNISSSTLLKVACAPAVLGLALLSSAAFAQDPQTADAADEGEAIIVTGSRIQTTSVTTVAPVQVLTSEAIQASGTINIQDELLKNPVFGTPTYGRAANAFNSAGPGIATVDLRNLGIDRTLVLVNGRRQVSGVPGANAVDLTTIPTALIERVEVLTSGSASAIYGSDAVAGVVNFILKDDFQGLELNAQSGIAQTGDDFNLDTSALIGGNFGDGRGNVTLFLGYSEQGAVMKRNHYTEAGQSNVDNISQIFYNGKLTTPRQPFLSGYSPQGTYYTDNYAWTYANNGLGALRPCAATNGNEGCDLSDTPLAGSALDGTQVGPDGYNRSAQRYLAVPVQRYLISGNAHYDVTDHVTAFFEGSFASTVARSQIEAFPWDTNTSGKQYANGQMPIETLSNGVIYRNPYVPDAIFNDASDTDGDGLRDIFVSKRLTDFGTRSIASTQQTFRIVGGLRGEIATNWNFEVFGNYGQTNVNQTGTGQINVEHFRESQQIIPDGAGGYICANPNAVANGCVPANVFGLNSFSPDALKYLEAPSNYTAVLKQTQVGANVTGSIPSLWGADPLGVTVGAEYRREASDESWDALQTLGLNGSNAFPPTSGQFDVKEAYGEVLVPLVTRGFVHDLSIRGAARYSDYSTVGNTFSWNAGGEFAPIPDIRFRAMYAVTVRAPNISELFAGANQDFPTVSDPCENIEATGGGALGANCRAAPGVLANIAASPSGKFTLTQSDRQGVTSYGGGNPNLSEERGKTFTAGVVINPRSIDALRNLTLTVDYFSVKIEDAIVDTPLSFILDQCYKQGNTKFCDFVVRRTTAQGNNSAGSLREVNNGPSNSGGIRTSGIDVTLNYMQGFHLGSQEFTLGLNGAYTHLISGYTIPLPGEDADLFKGEIGSTTDRFTTNVSISNEKFKLSFAGTYIGVSYSDDQFSGSPAGVDPDYRIHPEFYLDTQLRFYATDKFELYFGADNILNNKPAYFGGTPDAVTGQDSDTGTYDPIGRRFYAGVKVKL